MSDLERVSQDVVRAYTAKGMTLGAAESLTGGMIAAAVAGVPGASAVLAGGVVSYMPRVKHQVLAVEQSVIDTVGVVSEACALEMAQGARALLRVDVAVSATGVAGPTGGTAETPVGTVWLGVSGPKGAVAKRCRLTGDRQSIREQSAVAALKLALDAITEE